jgi:multidrug efflux pump subunit AcrA (membrane-fusion protein)
MVDQTTSSTPAPVSAGTAARMKATLEREARLVARRAEIDRREAALDRLSRATALAQRERALTERQNLIERIEQHLERSRVRLEERIRNAEPKREPIRFPALPRLQAVGAGYFAHGQYENEDDWWAKQLGTKPQRIAV